MEKFTVFGHKGFIGSNFVNYLIEKDIKLILPNRNEIPKENMGNVVYAIGKTTNFVEYPIETIDAHVCFLKKILEQGKFENFIYLSSTRIYNNLPEPVVDENTSLKINLANQKEIYNVSKLMGECLCLSDQFKNIKIVRISNVFGEGMTGKNFLGNLLTQAMKSDSITINETRDSGKDYVNINDVIQIIIKIISSGKYQIYNISSGKNILHYDIGNIFEKHGKRVNYLDNMKSLPPIISNKRLCEDIFQPGVNLLEYLDKIVSEFERE